MKNVYLQRWNYKTSRICFFIKSEKSDIFFFTFSINGEIRKFDFYGEPKLLKNYIDLVEISDFDYTIETIKLPRSSQ